MFNLQTCLPDFFARVALSDLYNEFSLQHELGFYLRQQLGATFKVQFERPISDFTLAQPNLPFVKKEIDIAIFTADPSEKYAIELKFPRNGQHPEQMFKACQDIRFLEQLCEAGFRRGYFLIVVDDKRFYTGGQTTGIYQYFRAGAMLHGHIQKPTGAKDEAVDIAGTYSINWKEGQGDCRYAVVEVNPPRSF